MHLPEVNPPLKFVSSGEVLLACNNPIPQFSVTAILHEGQRVRPPLVGIVEVRQLELQGSSAQKVIVALQALQLERHTHTPHTHTHLTWGEGEQKDGNGSFKRQHTQACLITGGAPVIYRFTLPTTTITNTMSHQLRGISLQVCL